jgi:ribonuclease HII
VPYLHLERAFWDEGRRRVAGVDEAGRGCLFGPVVAAAVILPPSVRDLADDRSGWPAWLREVNDSKLLAPAKRRRLALSILQEAEAVGLGQASPEEIDRLNIHQASLEAMRRAVRSLAPQPEALLLDGFGLKVVDYPQRPVKGGDRISVSIAAASILAKVLRDEMMMSLDRVFSGFGLERHKGYGTREHYQALARLGPTACHRRSFRLDPASKAEH